MTGSSINLMHAKRAADVRVKVVIYPVTRLHTPFVFWLFGEQRERR
jgi:hypothetical protein